MALPLNTASYPYTDKHMRTYRLVTVANPDSGRYTTKEGYRYDLVKEYSKTL